MSDEAIIERIRQGEHQMFAILVERYSQRVFSLIIHLVENEPDAEDLTQDVFVKAFSALPRFRGYATFASWLYSIAYNTACQRLRKQPPQALAIDNNVDSIADEAVDSFFANDTDERIDLLIKAIAQLPATDRTIIELFYYDEMHVKDIAQILTLSEGAVRNRLYLIRKRLYKMVTQN